MDLEARRSILTGFASVIEESARMKCREKNRSILSVRRTYEPGRLSPVWLAEAYVHVVPRHVRIVQTPVCQDELQHPLRQRQVGGRVG